MQFSACSRNRHTPTILEVLVSSCLRWEPLLGIKTPKFQTCNTFIHNLTRFTPLPPPCNPSTHPRVHHSDMILFLNTQCRIHMPEASCVYHTCGQIWLSCTCRMDSPYTLTEWWLHCTRAAFLRRSRWLAAHLDWPLYCETKADSRSLNRFT